MTEHRLRQARRINLPHSYRRRDRIAHKLANWVLNHIASRRYRDDIARLVQLGRDRAWELEAEHLNRRKGRR